MRLPCLLVHIFVVAMLESAPLLRYAGAVGRRMCFSDATCPFDCVRRTVVFMAGRPNDPAFERRLSLSLSP